jgi:hypothetical protein
MHSLCRQIIGESLHHVRLFSAAQAERFECSALPGAALSTRSEPGAPSRDGDILTISNQERAAYELYDLVKKRLEDSLPLVSVGSMAIIGNIFHRDR